MSVYGQRAPEDVIKELAVKALFVFSLTLPNTQILA